MSVFDDFLDVRQDTYDDLKAVPKPEPYKIGGSYYGSTELLSSVGNHLEIIDDESYTSYGYGLNINYSHLWGIRIGGAYKLEQYKRLREFLRERAKDITGDGYAVIDDYGTNFSVYGLALR